MHDAGEELRSGEAPGFFDPVLPCDAQSEDRHVAGQDQPMAECQGLAIERGKGQRDLVVVRHQVGNELERSRHLVNRVEQASEVAEDEHEPGDDGKRSLGSHQEADEDAQHGERE